MSLSIQQSTAVNALLNTTSNLALIARAGCGKTFTIIEMVKAYLQKFPRSEIAVAAYNAPIAAEVKAKLEALKLDWRAVSASTAHSLGFGLTKFRYKLTRENINEYKVRDIIKALSNAGDVYLEYASQIEALVGKAKQAGVGFFEDAGIGSKAVWYDLANRYDINDFEETDDLDRVVVAAQGVYRRSLADVSSVDFDDMILFPLVKNIHVKFAKDLVIVDEAQDLSRARQALLRKFVKPGTGRMVIVGDDRQAIYAFSGADSEALPRMVKELNATVLPLNVTWRCPKAVVALASSIVPDFTAHPEAPEGEVIYLKEGENPTDWSNTDAILCRNTAPLISTAYALLRAKVACRVEGKDIGKGISKLAQRWNIRTVAALLGRLDAYEAREIQKAMAKGKDAKIEQVRDQVDSLRFFCDGKTMIKEVVAAIDEMFGDEVKGVLTLASYHRSKGREWSRVILLRHEELCPSKWAKKDHERVQEENLAYVAMSRSKRTLVFWGGFKEKKEE